MFRAPETQSTLGDEQIVPADWELVGSDGRKRKIRAGAPSYSSMPFQALAAE